MYNVILLHRMFRNPSSHTIDMRVRSIKESCQISRGREAEMSLPQYYLSVQGRVSVPLASQGRSTTHAVAKEAWAGVPWVPLLVRGPGHSDPVSFAGEHSFQPPYGWAPFWAPLLHVKWENSGSQLDSNEHEISWKAGTELYIFIRRYGPPGERVIFCPLFLRAKTDEQSSDTSLFLHCCFHLYNETKTTNLGEQQYSCLRWTKMFQICPTTDQELHAMI